MRVKPLTLAAIEKLLDELRRDLQAALLAGQRVDLDKQTGLSTAYYLTVWPVRQVEFRLYQVGYGDNKKWHMSANDQYGNSFPVAEWSGLRWLPEEAIRDVLENGGTSVVAMPNPLHFDRPGTSKPFKTQDFEALIDWHRTKGYIPLEERS